jgi:toluene monooxygenase system protein A
MNEMVVKQFMDQFRDFGLELPWYWDDHFLKELDWYHHALHLGVWTWRQTAWWNPDAGVSPEERAWLEEKYPGWNDTFGKQWDVITENIRDGKPELTLPETFPMVCNMCQIPLVNPAGFLFGKLDSPEPLIVDLDGRRLLFCSEPCKWVYEQNPERFAGQLTIIDRFLSGVIQPATVDGALAYMGLSPEEQGQDATNYAWAFVNQPARQIAG